MYGSWLRHGRPGALNPPPPWLCFLARMWATGADPLVLLPTWASLSPTKKDFPALSQPSKLQLASAFTQFWRRAAAAAACSSTARGSGSAASA